MGRTSAPAVKSEILVKHASLSYRDGPYLLRIERKDGIETYSASDGHNTVSVPVQWSFGLGEAGQTYVLERDGIYYESRVSYYREIDLDLTMGHDREPPRTLSDALGRPLSKQEEFKCFSCHTSEGVVDRKLEPSHMQPGVTCENCHGPGSQHLEAMETQNWKNSHIFNPGHLGSADLNDFCGTCHRSTFEVLLTNMRGIRNVRFQPYRLEKSHCYDASDTRMLCIACHDPHEEVAKDGESYDRRCLACHIKLGTKASTTRKAPACPRAVSHCTRCHMPKLPLPGAHYKFTDHFIRVYHAGETYPD